MSEQTHIQRLRGDTAKNDAYTGVDGELTINQDSQSIRIHDGEKQGGFGTIDAAHYKEGELPAQVPNDLRTGAHVTCGEGRLEGGDAPHAEELAGDGLIAQGGTLNVDVDNLAGDGLVSTGDALSVDTEAFDKSYVKKSGDTMTGQLVVDRKIHVAMTDAVRGELPESAQFADLYFNDKEGTPGFTAGTLGGVVGELTVEGLSRTRVVANQNKVGSGTRAEIQCMVDMDGNVSTYAPTPVEGDASNNIATTKFVDTAVTTAIEAASENYVPKVGNSVVDGTLTVRHPLIIYNPDVERGVERTGSIYTELWLKDKNGPGSGVTGTSGMGCVTANLAKDTSSMTAIRNYKDIQGGSAYTYIGVGYDKDGNVMTYAPTPQYNDDSSKIATTAYVKRLIQVITTNKTIYVNAATGSDTLDANRGDTADKPFKTIRAAAQYAMTRFYVHNCTIYIRVAEGTYDENSRIYLGSYLSSNATITIDGAGAGKTIVNFKNDDGFHIIGGNTWDIRYMTINMTYDTNPSSRTSRTAIYGQRGTQVRTTDIEVNVTVKAGCANYVPNVLGCAVNTLINVYGFLRVNINDASGGTNRGSVFLVSYWSRLIFYGSNTTGANLETVINSNTSGIVIDATMYSVIQVNNGYTVKRAFTGTATGAKRYVVNNYSTVYGTGGSETFFPGTVAGEVVADSYSRYLK